MILHRPFLWHRPSFGRLCNGTSNAIRTTTIGFAGQTKLVVAWWEFSSTSAGTKCVAEMGADGFAASGGLVAIFRNDVAAGTMEVGWTSGGASTSTVARWTQPTNGQWNHICLNVNTQAATAQTRLPNVWVNGVAQSLTYSPTNGTTGSLVSEVVNIGSRNNGASFRNDAAFAQMAWIGGVQITQQDASSLYWGALHPKSLLLDRGTVGFVWQPDHVGSPDVLFTKGTTGPGYAPHTGTTLKEFRQNQRAGSALRRVLAGAAAVAGESGADYYIPMARRRGRR